MVGSERLRRALEAKRRAAALPGYLERLRVETGLDLDPSDLLSDEARHEREDRRQDADSSRERRSAGLSMAEATSLAERLRAALPDQIVLVGFGQRVPALARVSLHTLLGLAPRAALQWGDLFAATEDGSSALFLDLLMPGDLGNRHPEGSIEFSVRGPMFDALDLPELVLIRQPNS